MSTDQATFQPTLSDASETGNRSFLHQRKVWVPLSLLAVLLCGLGLRACARGGGKAAPQVRAVPVAVAVAKKAEMDVNYTGLGTVVTLDTVLVRTRVDGQVMKLGFREGQMVHQGDLLAEIDPRPFNVVLMQTEGQLAKDMAALKNATKDLQRFQTLAGQGILSRQQADAQVSLVDQYAAAVKVDEAQVAGAKLNLTYSHITSPISGKAGLRAVDAGNLVRATDATGIVTITPVQPINVMFTLPADQLQAVMAAVRSGRTLAAEAWDRDLSDKLATGTLQAMDNQIDPATGTIKLKALFKNEDLALFPNQFVNIRLKVDTLHDAVVIPSASLQRSPQGPYLYAVKADGTVDMRPVVVQFTDGDATAIRSGVAAGETVVTDGMEKLRPGAKVATAPADGKGPKKPGK
jgi:multidrug efflux system membrane fusion protein